MNFPFISAIYHLVFPIVTYDGSLYMAVKLLWRELQYSQYSTIPSRQSLFTEDPSFMTLMILTIFYSFFVLFGH